MLFDAAREGLWPFVPHKMKSLVHYDIDFMSTCLTMEGYFGDPESPWIVFGRVVIDRDLLVGFPEVTIPAVCDLMTNAIRFRAIDSPISSNIILGEE